MEKINIIFRFSVKFYYRLINCKNQSCQGFCVSENKSMCFLFLSEFSRQKMRSSKGSREAARFGQTKINNQNINFIYLTNLFRLSNAICITQPNYSWIGSITLKKGLLISSLFQFRRNNWEGEFLCTHADGDIRYIRHAARLY